MGYVIFLLIAACIVGVVILVIKRKKQKREEAIAEFKKSNAYAFALQIKEEIEKRIEWEIKMKLIKEGWSWSSIIELDRQYNKPHVCFILGPPEVIRLAPNNFYDYYYRGANKTSLLIEASMYKPGLEHSIKYTIGHINPELNLRGKLLENINMGVYLHTYDADANYDWTKFLNIASKKMKALGYGTGNFYYNGELENDLWAKLLETDYNVYG